MKGYIEADQKQPNKGSTKLTNSTQQARPVKI